MTAIQSAALVALLVFAIVLTSNQRANANEISISIESIDEISEQLLNAWYQGDTATVLSKIGELEELVAKTNDKTALWHAHFQAGLGWRDYSAISAEKIAGLKAAVPHLEKAIELAPERPEAHALLANVYRRMVGAGERDADTIHQAMIHREKAYQLGPANPMVLMFEASALVSIPEDRGGNIQEGLAAGFEAIGRFQIEGASSTKRMEAEAWTIVGSAFQKLGQPELALKAYTKALEAQPNWKAIRDNVIPALKNSDSQSTESPQRSGNQDHSGELKVLLQERLDQIASQQNMPGATLAVALPDGTILAFSTGFKDREKKQKLNVDARMFCGSTGKTFVSAVALQLISEGQFGLDDLASSHFDNEQDLEWYAGLPNAETITVRSLMNHTSGLPRYLFQKEYLADLIASPLKVRTPQEGLSALHGKQPIHPVGQGWAYSDSNYLVLGLLIEKVTSKKYYDIASERLLGPLKLAQTIPATQAKLPELVQGHIGSVNPFGLPEKTVHDGQYAMNPVFEWCGGGYVTCASDLARWLRALHSGKVLDDEMYSQLITPVDFATGQPGEQGYGLGTFVWQTDNGRFFGHAGIMPGYLTQIEFSQDHQFAIALQTNSDEGMGQRLHEQVQSIARLIIDNAKK